MGRKLRQVLESLPAGRRKAIEAKAETLVREMIQASLQDIRKEARKTQAQMAESMGLAQHAVSQLERRSDMLVSTLDRFARALGGRLMVVVRLPGGADYLVDQGAAPVVHAAGVAVATTARHARVLSARKRGLTERPKPATRQKKQLVSGAGTRRSHRDT
jgi:transcriptional regulator with XRE-family HTH domain